MIQQDFGQIFNELAENLQKALKKKEPINALIMDEVFQTDDDGSQAFITFDGEILMIENRQNADVWVAMTDTELWQIIAFALDNGLQLPQNEGGGLEKIPFIYETGTCQDCAFWGQVVPGGVWGDCRTDAGNIPLNKLPNKWGGEIQTKYHFTCKSWCQRGYGPGQDGKEYPPSKVDGVSMGENYD